ncbi:lysophospholipase L1-like esterase [Clostridium pascui]|uniref:GDSL-type esterase/lipase family protein n=1 Tax=Clostridium pascui TaxID=46609 RepID=UPI001959E591|nr:GDSL-type esterase/lipase family protein [Clostridium pascui]MBM7871133.1 lysophospholipase L1-like esterase [Clostridium pascui]
MKIVCIGDSLTYGYGVPKENSWIHLASEISNNTFINSGLNGDTTSGMLFRLEEDLIALNPDKAFIMGGTNDFLMGYKLQNTIENIDLIIDECIHNNITPYLGIQMKIDKKSAELYWSSYINYDEVNLKIEEYRTHLIKKLKSQNLVYFDFYEVFENNLIKNLYTDGIHPSIYGHKLMSSIIEF